MRPLGLMIFFILSGCSQALVISEDGALAWAFDSMARGKIHARAIKTVYLNSVCFDISLVMTGAEERQVLPTNWTVAWMDQKKMYHLLKLNQRDPASVPKVKQIIFPTGTYQRWSNNLKTCVPNTKADSVQALVMTPKDMPFSGDNELVLSWK